MKKIYIILLLSIFYITGFAQQKLPYSQSFENGFGIWQQGTGDDLDWTRWTDTTPTPYTGPRGAYDGKYYIYIESDSNLYNPAHHADLIGLFDFSNCQMPMLSFYYNMYGQYINYLEVDISTDSVNWTEIDKIIGNQGPDWHREILCLGDYAGKDSVYIKFTAWTSGENDPNADQADIALDLIQLTDFRIDSVEHTDVTCAGYSDGSITINVSGGFPPYQYSIDGALSYTPDTLDTVMTFDSLPGKTYWIYTKAANKCAINYGYVTVNEPPAPDITVDTQYVKPCEYSHNGVITVAAHNGNAPFQYSIHGLNGPFTTDTTFSDLDTGYYHVVVKDDSGCIFDQGQVHIAALYKIHYLGSSITNITSCYGDNTGAITISATGGYQPLYYSIDTGKTYQQNYSFTDLYAGNYVIAIKDAHGCVDTVDTVTITQPPQVRITGISHVDITGCYGDSTGQINISATGGTGALQYSINNGVNFYQNHLFTNLPANQYIIYVRDSNNCKAGPDTVVITQPPKLVITGVDTTNIHGCYGDSTGTIEIHADGGTPTLFYSIDNGKTFQVLNYFDSLPAGKYYPVVKDQNGCTTAFIPITLKQPDSITISSVSYSNVQTCYGDSTGSITIYAYGGSGQLLYSVDSGSTFQPNSYFDSLTAGNYFLIVKDQHNCVKPVEHITLTQPPKLVITEQTSTNVRCYGTNSGTIKVSTTGGTGTVLYSINGGETFAYISGTTANVYAGTYKIVVKDNNGCITQGSTLVVTQPPQLVFDTVYIHNVNTCYGDSTGSIVIVASGGVRPYQYSINYGQTYQADSVFDSLPASTNYYPYIKDANNCLLGYHQISILQPNRITFNSVTHKDIDTCHGVPVGQINIQITGGTQPYYYSIDSGKTFADTCLFQNLYAGTYYITVKDAHNCQQWYTAPVTISQPDTLTLDSMWVHNISCYGRQDGNVYIFAHGGKPQLMYYLNDTLPSIVNSFQSLGPGHYTVTVRDAYHCQVSDTFSIYQPPKFILDSVTHTNVTTCYGDNTATITVYVHGGTSPYAFAYTSLQNNVPHWSTSNVFKNLAAGPYYVTARDHNGCQVQSQAFNITQPSKVVLTNYDYRNLVCHGDTNGYIIIHATGGQGKYWYSIDSGKTWSQDSSFYNLGPGNYHLVLKDINNCFATYTPTVSLTDPPKLIIDTVTYTDVSCFNYSDGSIHISASGGTTPLQYSIDTPKFSYSPDFLKLSPGKYPTIVKDSRGCIVFGDTVEIHNKPNYALFTVDQNKGCSPLKVAFHPKYPQNTTFKWDFGDGSVSYATQPEHYFINNLNKYVTYKVIAHSSHGVCSDTSSTIITLLPKPSINISIDSTVMYYPDTIVKLYNYTTQLDSFTWDYGDGIVEHVTQPLVHPYPGCGIYTLKVSACNYLGCYDTIRRSINITAIPPSASFVIDNYSGCAPLKVHFENISSNAQSYLWDFGDGDTSSSFSPTHIFQIGGTYMVRLTAYGYCNTQNYSEQPVYVYPKPVADFYVQPDTASVGQNVAFINESTGADYYKWFFGDSTYSTEPNPVHVYKKAGIFDITLIAKSNNGCVDTAYRPSAITIVGDMMIQFPTAFTPNGDGRNDYFKPVIKMVKQAKLYIFDRYGNIVFETDDPMHVFWDGTDGHGHKLPQDVYVWKIVGKYINGQPFVKVGDVTLLR